jgi:glycosyltransferase involved in cell wall biosynthesis
MKILFVAMSASVHAARCINQVSNLGWDIRLFDCMDSGYIHPELQHVTVYHSLYPQQKTIHPTVKPKGLRLPIGTNFVITRLRRWQPNYRVRRLARLIQQFKPDIIHSLEFQHSGYLVLEAREWLKSHGVTAFPIWMLFSWGSDIYLFNRMPAHKQRIYELLQQADYYQCECQRDVLNASAIGMKAIQLPLGLAPGGLDLEQAAKLRQLEKPSTRRVIALRGYQNWAGRALFGLKALELCVDVLQDYTVMIYSPGPEEDMRIASTLFAQKTGIPVEFIPSGQPHGSMLELFARCRIFIGISISDGVSYSMLEMMAVGTFPIQSDTACADEWLIDGESGFIVPAEEPQTIAVAIRRALTDDDLVDRAAEINAKVCEERVDANKIREQVIDIYTAIGEHRQL